MNGFSTLIDRGWKGLLLMFGVILLTSGSLPQQAVAQPLPCDSIEMTARGGENCCFTFLLENGSNLFIPKVTMTSIGALPTSAGGPSSSQVSRTQNMITWTFANGIPSRSDGFSACFQTNTGSNAFWVVVQYYNGQNQVICSDSIRLECGTNQAGCIDIVEQEVVCREDGRGWMWHFNVKNRSNFYGRNYRIEPVTQGISIAPDSGIANSPIAPNSSFSRHHANITGGQGGQVVAFRVIMCGSSTANSRDVECCTTMVEVRLPVCEEPGCISIRNSSIKCETTAGGISYLWCFSFTNNLPYPVNSVQVGNSVVSLNQPVAPNGTGEACIRLYGQPGPTTVSLLVCGNVRIDSLNNNDSTFTERRCCDMKVQLELPKCAESGCLELVNPEIVCDSTGWRYCFNVRNQSNFTATNIIVSAWQAQQFSQPLQPGALSQRMCIFIPRVPNVFEAGVSAPVTVILRGNAQNQYCADTLFVKLPECEPTEKDCCDGFIIQMAQSTPVAASNGFTGLLSLVGAGPAPIKKVVASVVSSSVNGQPAYGYAVNGLILNGFGAGTVTPGQYGREIIWTNPNGVQMMNPAFSLNWLRFPPMAPNVRTDTVRFCVRWEFTDVNCRTCDTLICYTAVRRRLFSVNDFSEAKSGGSATTQSADGGMIGGELTGDNTGHMTILLPKLPEEEFGTVTYTGISVQADNGAMISNAVDSDGKITFTTTQGLAAAEFSASSGQSLNFDLDYIGLDGAASLGHFVLLSYTTDLLPNEELQIPVTVTLRRSDATGGDVVTAVSAEVPDAKVETFALHLKNSNKTGEGLAGLHLQGLGGLKILAVGPTSSETQAMLRFGVNGENGRAYISEASEGTVSLASGEERNPIYLTVALTDLEISPTIQFSTLNEFDEVVSQGEVNLLEISSINHDGGSASTGGIQLGSVIPNPSNHEATLSFRVDRSENVTLVVRDVRGREVLRIFNNESVDAGSHVVNFNVADLPSGQYFYTLETSTGLETRPMTIAR